jgi:hypothetical protein
LSVRFSLLLPLALSLRLCCAPRFAETPVKRT